MVLSTINRTLKSYALAIVGAEYVLRWLPAGTHQWDRFVTPDELARYRRARPASMRLSCEGLVYDPLRDSWSLGPDTDVNYIGAAAKPALVVPPTPGPARAAPRRRRDQSASAQPHGCDRERNAAGHVAEQNALGPAEVGADGHERDGADVARAQLNQVEYRARPSVLKHALATSSAPRNTNSGETQRQ